MLDAVLEALLEGAAELVAAAAVALHSGSNQDVQRDQDDQGRGGGGFPAAT